MTMAEEMFIEDSNGGYQDYEWDGDQDTSDEAQKSVLRGENPIVEDSIVSSSLINGVEKVQTENARALSGSKLSPVNSMKNDGLENTFPFTSLYRVKTPIRFMKPRSGRPRSALSNNSQSESALGRTDCKDSVSSTSTTVVSDDPRRLLDVKLSRRRAEEDFQLMRNRIQRLRIEEERAQKNIEDIRKRADEIIRLKAQNELRARAKEHARMLKEKKLMEETQERAIAQAQLNASVRARRNEVFRAKSMTVQQCRHERLEAAQRAWEARRAEEERAARLKQEVYQTERQAVQRKYRNKHLMQMRAVQSYEQRVVDNEKRRIEREAAIEKMEREEAELLARLRQAQVMQQACYTELEMALEV